MRPLISFLSLVILFLSSGTLLAQEESRPSNLEPIAVYVPSSTIQHSTRQEVVNPDELTSEYNSPFRQESTSKQDQTDYIDFTRYSIEALTFLLDHSMDQAEKNNTSILYELRKTKLLYERALSQDSTFFDSIPNQLNYYSQEPSNYQEAFFWKGSEFT